MRAFLGAFIIGSLLSQTQLFAQEYMPPAPVATYSTTHLPSVRSGYVSGWEAMAPVWTGSGAPGGYDPRIGSPYHYFSPSGYQGSVSGNPYQDHFGPGFHRNDLHGHYRFPYYSYRAPWYYPGRAVYNRDTNYPW